ncbi:MAG: hypothetical protein WBI20_02960 [Burkholderiaceae bacterium]
MLKPLSYPDILLGLPVDQTLRLFLERAKLALPATLEWTDDIATSKALILAVQSCAQIDVRDRVVAALHVIAQMCGPMGIRALFQAVREDKTLFAEIIQCRSDMHRAFWLFVHHPKLFEQASDIEYADQHIPQAQQHELGVCLPVRRNEQALVDFGASIRQFYQQEVGCGDVCLPQLLDRAGGTQMLSVHVKDRPTLTVEFAGVQLRRRVGSPIIHMVLEYSQATGVVRSVIKGGAKYQQMLADAFALHMLGVDVSAKRIKPPSLDLTALRLGFQVPQALRDGFVAVQVKHLTVLSPDQALEVDFTATPSSAQRCVTDLMAEHFSADNPLHRTWEIEAASINLYYAPSPGGSRSKVITVEVTRRGRLNLHKYDEQLRSQLEGYLITLGVMGAQQRLAPKLVATQEVLLPRPYESIA